MMGDSIDVYLALAFLMSLKGKRASSTDDKALAKPGDLVLHSCLEIIMTWLAIAVKAISSF